MGTGLPLRIQGERTMCAQERGAAADQTWWGSERFQAAPDAGMRTGNPRVRWTLITLYATALSRSIAHRCDSVQNGAVTW